MDTVSQADPNQSKPEDRQMAPKKGEPSVAICNWLPALESSLKHSVTNLSKCPWTDYPGHDRETSLKP